MMQVPTATSVRVVPLTVQMLGVVVWSSAFALSMIKGDARNFAERSVAEHPAPTEAEIKEADAAVGKYMPKQPEGEPRGDQRWSTFLRNHAKAIVACDFFVAVTATFRLLYVFVVIEHGARRLLHFNVTEHPTAAWTLQQLRNMLGFESRFRFLIHDRDNIFSGALDQSIRGLGLRVLRTPLRAPNANAICEACNWNNPERVP